jgi:hypothetical protein
MKSGETEIKNANEFLIDLLYDIRELHHHEKDAVYQGFSRSKDSTVVRLVLWLLNPSYMCFLLILSLLYNANLKLIYIIGNNINFTLFTLYYL